MQIRVEVVETPQALRAVHRLHYDVRVVERHQYTESADVDEQLLTHPQDHRSTILGAWVGDELVGAIQFLCGDDGPIPSELRELFDTDRFAEVVDPKTLCFVFRMSIREEHRSSPAVYLLGLRVYRTAVQRGMNVAFVDAAPHQVDMYRRAGYSTYRSNVDDPSCGLLVPMCMLLPDVDYLATIRSPHASDGRAHAFPLECPPRLLEFFAELRRRDEHLARTFDPEELYGLLESHGTGNNSLLRQLDETEASVLLDKCERVTYRAGDPVIKKGATGRNVFFILEGGVEARDEGFLLRTLGVGEIFGEINFILGLSRTADVYAAPGGATILSLSDATLRELIESHPAVAAKLYRNIASVLCLRQVAMTAELVSLASSRLDA